MTGFTDHEQRMLQAKLDDQAIKTRKQAGQQLSYVEGWWVMAKANEIFGHDGWDRETVDLPCVTEDTYHKTKWDNGTRAKVAVKDGDGNAIVMHRCGYMVRVRVSVRAGDVLVVREGTGFGSGFGEDPSMTHEGAVKEAETDALKRALVTFGHQLGLALYDKDRLHVGDTWADTAETEIEALSTLDALKAWWSSNSAKIQALGQADRDRLTRAKDARKAQLQGGSESAAPAAPAPTGRTSGLDALAGSDA